MNQTILMTHIESMPVFPTFSNATLFCADGIPFTASYLCYWKKDDDDLDQSVDPFILTIQTLFGYPRLNRKISFQLSTIDYSIHTCYQFHFDPSLDCTPSEAETHH